MVDQITCSSIISIFFDPSWDANAYQEEDEYQEKTGSEHEDYHVENFALVIFPTLVVVSVEQGICSSPSMYCKQRQHYAHHYDLHFRVLIKIVQFSHLIFSNYYHETIGCEIVDVEKPAAAIFPHAEGGVEEEYE